jgi:sugar lactone lactonase YvrE
VADLFNYSVRKITPAGVVTTLAGTARPRGSSDGTGTAARFNEPGGVAADTAGNIYLADHGNHTIRRITSGGTVTTLAGTAGVRGSVDGPGPAARFDYPGRVATDTAGNIYVTDGGNGTIRKITPAGIVTTLAGTAGVRGSMDGTGAAARFDSPIGIATDSAGNVCVADVSNNNIRKITPAGMVSTLAGMAGTRGSTDGTGAAARFYGPLDLATDSVGNVYVAEYENKTIRKITPAGVVTTLAGMPGVRGSTDGTGSAARFYEPEGLAVDSAGNVYVADRRNHTIRKITPDGVVTTIVGAPGLPGFVEGELPGRIGYPVSVAVSGTSLYVTLHNGVAVVRNRP